MILQSCVLFFSLLNGINPAVTNAVIHTESKGNPFAQGSLDDIGLMQIREKFVPENRLQLQQPCTNIMRGTQLLAEAKKRCKHTKDGTWLVCFNAGIRGGSRLKYPLKFPYYVKVMSNVE